MIDLMLFVIVGIEKWRSWLKFVIATIVSGLGIIGGLTLLIYMLNR